MTNDEYNDVKQFQDDVEREIITLKTLIPDPRMLEMLSITTWRADPDEEEQKWVRLALSTARRIREHQPYPTQVIHA